MSRASAPTVAVIVVAAGSGTRLGRSLPKAFVDLAGRTILEHSLRGVFGMRIEAQIIVVAPADLLDEARGIAAAAAGAASGYVDVVAGGATRQDSVANGVAVLGASVDTVLVHDAARALTPPAQFDRVVDAVRATGRGAVPGLPLVDTVKRVTDADIIVATVDRSQLSAVQTPQGFSRRALDDAYALADSTGDFTDDAALLDALGSPSGVVDGDPLAFKITTAWDLRRAEQLLRDATAQETRIPSLAGRIRTGIGIDVHAFDETAPLWLACLHWPGETGLAGHSDGDPVAHAICDALLSAAGLGDIGGVFGTADPRFDGAHGSVFLEATRAMVEGAGFSIINASVQLVGNRPRFGPRRHEAEAAVSGLLGAPVSIGATTSDALGFTGRGEGVTAVATAILERVAP